MVVSPSIYMNCVISVLFNQYMFCPSSLNLSSFTCNSQLRDYDQSTLFLILRNEKEMPFDHRKKYFPCYVYVRKHNWCKLILFTSVHDFNFLFHLLHNRHVIFPYNIKILQMRQKKCHPLIDVDMKQTFNNPHVNINTSQ